MSVESSWEGSKRCRKVPATTVGSGSDVQYLGVAHVSDPMGNRPSRKLSFSSQTTLLFESGPFSLINTTDEVRVELEVYGAFTLVTSLKASNDNQVTEMGRIGLLKRKQTREKMSAVRW